MQCGAVADANERKLSLEYSEIANKHAKKLKARGTDWKLRAEFIALEGALEEVEAYAKQRVTEEGADIVNAAMEGTLGDNPYVGLFHPPPDQSTSTRYDSNPTSYKL